MMGRWLKKLGACDKATGVVSVDDAAMEGDQHKMREALLEARRFVWASAQRTDRDLLVTDDEKRGPYGPYVLSPKDTLAKIDAALAAPPRNCDVGTPQEQWKRFDEFCIDWEESGPDGGCSDECPCLAIKSKESDGCFGQSGCFFIWAQMPYEAERKGDGK